MKKFKLSKHYADLPLEFNNKIISKSHDIRIYKDAVLLTPGVWADSITNTDVLYRSDILSKYSTNWSSNYIDLQHSHHPLDMCGTVRFQRFNNGKLLGDLHIDMKLDAGKKIVPVIDSGLANQLSIEMMTQDFWDSHDMVRYAGEITFIGLAILGGPSHGAACSDARIK